MYLKKHISKATSNFIWANDNKTIFYVQQNKNTLRACQVFRFNIETGKKSLMFEEKDLKFSVYLNKTLCKTWITLLSLSKQTTEYHYLPADQPSQSFTLFCKREKNHEYHISYGGKDFYILSNKDKAFNFKLMRARAQDKQEPVDHKNNIQGSYPSSVWQELIPHRLKTFIEEYEVFKQFIVLKIRYKGYLSVEVFDRQKKNFA